METNPKIVKLLRRVPVLENLSDDVLSKLANQVTECSLVKDEVLFNRGDMGDALYLIRSGWVKVVIEDSDGDEVTLNHCGPNEVIGEMSIIDGEPRSAGIAAISSDVELLKLKRETFIDAVMEQPQLALDLMH